MQWPCFPGWAPSPVCCELLLHAKAHVTPGDKTSMLEANLLIADPCIAACALPHAAVASRSKHALAIRAAWMCSVKKRAKYAGATYLTCWVRV